MALQVDREVETPAPNHSEKWREGPWRAPPLVNDQLVEPRMTLQNRPRFRFDRPRDVRFGPSAANPSEQRQRADDIADRAEQNNQYAARRAGRRSIVGLCHLANSHG